MNEIDFRKRVYTDPTAADQEILDSAASNPNLQNILNQTQKMDEDMRGIINAVGIPDGLKEKLLSIPESEQTTDTSSDTLSVLAGKPAANSDVFQYFAVAASIMLAVGITLSRIDRPAFRIGPGAAGIAFGKEVIDHL